MCNTYGANEVLPQMNVSCRSTEVETHSTLWAKIKTQELERVELRFRG